MADSEVRDRLATQPRAIPAAASAEPEAGPLLFARFAFRPNTLGYCGGDDARSLFEHVRAGVIDHDLVRLDLEFEGARPYLELIAAANGIADPLDRRVVAAYWLGNGLLDRVPAREFGDDLRRRFRARTPAGEWRWLASKPGNGARPHHNVHVYEVLPRTGLLRSGRVTDVVSVMGECSIRAGHVVEARSDELLVTARALEYVNGKLALGEPRVEHVLRSLETSPDSAPLERSSGSGFVDEASPGDWVAIHWRWACGLLTERQVRALEQTNARAIEMANRTL